MAKKLPVEEQVLKLIRGGLSQDVAAQTTHPRSLNSSVSGALGRPDRLVAPCLPR